MDITKFLNSKGLYDFEGYSQQVQGQVQDLIQLTNMPNAKVMEIGFNAGHSAEVFLQNNPTLHLTSFDLGAHNYVHVAKEYIDNTFPNRHTLILGDSRHTVPKFIVDNNSPKFDVIFIDGGHDYDVANTDMYNCYHLAHKNTIVILDDTVFTPGWEQSYTIGPTKVWTEFVERKKLYEFSRRDYCHGRGMSFGKYIF